jgi:tetratricopeptide (TPR) repeat protein
MIFLSFILSFAAQQLSPELILNHPGHVTAEYNAVQRDLIAALEQEPNSPYAADALTMLSEISYLCNEEIAVDRWADLVKQINHPDASRKVRKRLLRELDRRLYRGDPLDIPTDLFADYITNWAVVGPFGSTSCTVPLDLAPADDAPVNRLQRKYYSPWGSTLNWNELKRRANSTRVSPAKLVPGQVGCGYLLAYLKGAPQPAQLELYCDEDVDVFWNGRLLTQKRGYLSSDGQSRLMLPLQLAQQNLLLIRFDADTAPEVAARLLTTDGASVVQESGLPGIQQMLEQPPTAWQGNFGAYPIPSETFHQQQARQHPDPTLGDGDRMLRMYSNYRHGRVDLALAEKMPSDGPWLSTWVRLRHHALAEAWHLPAEVRRRDQLAAELLLQKLAVVDARIEVRKVFRMMGEDKLEQGIELAQRLAEDFTGVPYLEFLAIQGMGNLDRTGLLVRQRTVDFAARYPEHGPALVGLSNFAGRSQQPDLAMKYLHQALRADGSQTRVLSDLLDLLVESTSDQRQLARKLFQQRDQLYPQSSNTRNWRRRLMQERNLVAEMRQEMEQALAKRPFAVGRHHNLIEHYLEHGQLDLARERIEQLMKQHPGGNSWASTLQLLGVTPPEEQFFDDFAPDRAAALASADAATDASTALVLDSGMYYFYADGSHRRMTHTISKALDRKGTEQLHEQGAYPGTRIARVIRPDGQIFEPVLVDRNWVMPALNPGDLVEIQFASFHDGTPGAVPDPGWWRFASFSEPFVLSRYVVYLPSSLKGEWRKFQFDGEHQQVPWGDGTVHIFTQHLSPRLEEEPLRPSDNEVLPWVQYGSDLDLKEAAAAFRWTFTQVEAVPADLQEPLQQVLRQLAAADRNLPLADQQLLRARAIYDWVTEHVQDFSNMTPMSEVYHSKRGYPIGLIAALLRLDGIPFEWAIAHPPTAPQLHAQPANAFRSQDDFGQLLLHFPNVSDANQAWMALPFGGRGFPFLRISPDLAGARVIVLGTDGQRMETLPIDALKNSWDTDFSVTYSLQADHSAATTGSVRITTSQGSLMRERVLNTEPEQRSQIARQIVSSLVPGLDLEGWEFLNLQQRGADFELRFNGTVPKFVLGKDGNNGCRLRLQPMQLANAFGAVERQWPLAFRIISRLRWQIEVQTNGLYTIEYGPNSFLDERPGFGYRFDVEKEDDRLKVVRQVEIAGLWLEPEELAPFLETANQQEQEEKRAVRLKAKP